MTEILLLLAIIIPLHLRTEHRLTKIESKLDRINGGEKNGNDSKKISTSKS